MSGSLATKRISASAVNWARLAQHTPAQQVDAMRSVRSKNEALVTRVNTLPADLPAIDWARFAKSVPVPGLVDKFRKEYEALKVPYPRDTEGWHELVDAQQKHQTDCVAKAQTLLTGVRDAAKLYLKNLDEKIPAREEWTMETVVLYFPERAADPNKPDINRLPSVPEYRETPNKNRLGTGIFRKL